jgi:DNA-binding response OmpR family regulator
MLNVIVVDNTLRLGLKLAKIINYNFNLKVKNYNYSLFNLNTLIAQNAAILFLDISYTSQKSLEIIKQIRQNPKTKDISVILTTSVIQKEILIEFLQFNIVDVIIKPYDFEKLDEQLKTIFNKISAKRNITLQELLNNKLNENFLSNSYLFDEIKSLQKDYMLLIKDILRQEFRTRIKTKISFDKLKSNKLEEAVVYSAIYKSFNNKTYSLSLISTYNDILSIFSKKSNKTIIKLDFEILQTCDEFSQSIFNRIFSLFKNMIKGLNKTAINFAFYNSYTILEDSGIVLPFENEMQQLFVLQIKRLDNEP